MATLSSRLLLAAFGCLSFIGACSEDDAPPPKPISYKLELSSFDGRSVDEPLPLRCDGTLALALTITTVPARQFLLRPKFACGASTRCGYVHFEARGPDGQVLASVDTATNAGVLRLTAEQLPLLSSVHAALLRGIDGDPITNPDKSEVVTEAEPTFVQPTACAAPTPGEAGAGGQPAAGGDSGLGGAGGASSVEPLPGGAGAGGAAGQAGAGGA